MPSKSEAKGDGPINIDHFADNDFLRSRAEAAERSAIERRKRMSPPGALGLPPLLEERRLEYGITDGFFRVAMSFSEVSLFQVPPFLFEGKYSKDSPIEVPETVQEADKWKAPRGVLCGAGLKAMKVLHTNGFQLGDIVYFVRMSPWEVDADRFAGKTERMLVLPVGSLVGSEDLATRIARGEARMVWVEEHSEYQYVDRDGRMWSPEQPFTPPEM